MRIYHAAVNVYVLNEYKKRFPNREVHVLRAHSHKNGDDRLLRTTHRSKCASLYYDSGTYYFYKVAEFPGSPVNFNIYLRYLKYYRKYYDRVYNFDCDFGDEGFDTNIFYQKRLEDEGLDPVPVVHSIHGDEIEYYILQGYEDVALGSPQITDFGTLAYVMNKFKERHQDKSSFVWQYAI